MFLISAFRYQEMNWPRYRPFSTGIRLFPNPYD